MLYVDAVLPSVPSFSFWAGLAVMVLSIGAFVAFVSSLECSLRGGLVGLVLIVAGGGGLALTSGGAAQPTWDDRYGAVQSAISDEAGLEFFGNPEDAVGELVGRRSTASVGDAIAVPMIAGDEVRDCLIGVVEHTGDTYRFRIACDETSASRTAGGSGVR